VTGHIGPAMELKAKVWLERRGRFVLGDGGVALLELVDELRAEGHRIGGSLFVPSGCWFPCRPLP